MGLEDVYNNSVRGSGRVYYNGYSPNSVPKSGFERDPYFINLEKTVFSKIADIGKEAVKELPEVKENNLKEISVEDAIKELMELEKSIDNSQWISHNP